MEVRSIGSLAFERGSEMMRRATMTAVVGLIGLVLWGIGRYAARNLESFTWPQEFALLAANLGLVVMGTAVVFFFWSLLRQGEIED